MQCDNACVDNIVGNSHLRRLGRYNLIWKLKVPPKIKNLVWRVCRGYFPTTYVSCQTNCVVSSANYEDGIHVLLECHTICILMKPLNLKKKIYFAFNFNSCVKSFGPNH